MLFEQKNKIWMPTIKKQPKYIQNLIKEGKYNPPDRELLPEAVGFWGNEIKKSGDLFENGWPTAIYSRGVRGVLKRELWGR